MNEEIHSPIITIPSTSYHIRVIIIAKISDFSRFNSPDKILAYAERNVTVYIPIEAIW